MRTLQSFMGKEAIRVTNKNASFISFVGLFELDKWVIENAQIPSTMNIIDGDTETQTQ